MNKITQELQKIHFKPNALILTQDSADKLKAFKNDQEELYTIAHNRQLRIIITQDNHQEFIAEIKNLKQINAPSQEIDDTGSL